MHKTELLAEIRVRQACLHATDQRRQELMGYAWSRRLARFGGDRLLEVSSPGTVFDEMTQEEGQEWGRLTADRSLQAAAYNELVDQWNALRNAQLRERAKVVQTRRNARAVAAVRQAACPVCFTTHAGEC